MDENSFKLMYRFLRNLHEVFMLEIFQYSLISVFTDFEIRFSIYA